MAETTLSFTTNLHIEAMQTAIPSMVSEPGQCRRLNISEALRPETFQNRFHIILYFKKEREEESGLLVAGWIKESLSAALTEQPMFAGRLRRVPESGRELLIVFNDSGVRLVQAQMEMTISEFLDLDEREREEPQLYFWNNIDEQNPQYSALFYVQVTNFEGDGYSIGLSWSPLLADPLLMTSFIQRWAHIHNNLLAQNDVPKIPLFYLPNYKKTGHSNFSHFTSAPSYNNHITTIFNISQVDAKRIEKDPVLRDSHNALASIFLDKVVQATADVTISSYSLISVDRSGNSKIENFKKEGTFLPETSSWGSLTPLTLDDLMVRDVSFYKGNMPLRVSYRVESAPGEGLVVIMPSPDEGSLGVTISATVPKRKTNVILGQ